MSSNNKVSFTSFLKKFPKIDLPITLSIDTHFIFSKNNKQLHPLEVDQFISLVEGPIADEFTEVIPCFSLKDTKDFHAIVYWKAALLDYQYVLATFTKKGVPIARKVIAGTFSDGVNIAQSVATIDSDWTINIVTGAAGLKEEYDATKSTAIEVDLLADGHIMEGE